MPSLSRTRLGIAAALAAAMTALLTAALLTTAAPNATAATNLVADPGFESGLTGWTCDAGTATVVSSPVHAGTKALSGTPSSAADAQCTQTISVAPNSAYTLTAFVQGSYVYLGATGTGVNASTWTASAPSYQQLSTTFTTGASTTSVTVFVHGWYGQPAYYADDVSLTGPAGTPPTSTTDTTTTTTTVTPPPNTGWTHPVYLMPLDNNPPSISAIVAGSGEKEFNLAFVLDSGGCTPAWDGSSTQLVSNDTAVAGQINAIRAAGGDAAVSFGGYNGTELGTTCGSAAALAAAYQQVITKYQLKHVDFDYENGALDANTAVRFGAIATLERNNPNLVVSLTIPMTTVGFPGSGTDEIRAAVAAGARLDIVNIMDFDTGLTSGTEVAQTENIATTAASQLASIYGWSTATAWAHLGLQLMNGHSDQPSELFTQDTFTQLLSFAQANHPAWFSYWSVNRDFQCPAGVPENWAPGTCSNITQAAYDFTKIIVRY
ncbi:carbohydrate binding domain-containing protein [Kutzneria buriramensis]|uniref:Carbohydrate binding protein n=1 Tax=Kutzneria buriramensis TaxID=1045776 RepID=A0A3E0HFY3_9PSEU|nr:carbohydrate binding domain-containing protein [Kutzneria buriramensis]REH43715.1 carbohydrate binding protein [Kutzneria buriramensis]